VHTVSPPPLAHLLTMSVNRATARAVDDDDDDIVVVVNPIMAASANACGR
jgi:hypothetical protein